MSISRGPEVSIADRDQLNEMLLLESNLETGFGVLGMMHNLALIPEVTGYALSRKSPFPHIVDVLVSAQEDLTRVEGGPLEIPSVAQRIKDAVVPFQDAAQRDGEARPRLGEFVPVGFSRNPNRNPDRFSRAVRSYMNFAARQNRGDISGVVYFYEEDPLVPVADLPRKKFALAPRSIFEIAKQSKHAEKEGAVDMLNVLGAIAGLPDVKGFVQSKGVNAHFVDLFVDSAQSVLDRDVLEGQVNGLLGEIQKGMQERGEKEGFPSLGCMVPVSVLDTFDRVKEKYLQAARLNRRRTVLVGAYFRD